jgi:hypothetical protein
MKNLRIRAILFEEAGAWCAQCLEYDIAAQARTQPELREELVGVLTTHMLASAAFGQEPFAGLPAAPAKFFAMYEGAALGVKSEKQSVDAAGFAANLEMLPLVDAKRVARSRVL